MLRSTQKNWCGEGVKPSIDIDTRNLGDKLEVVVIEYE